MITSYLQGFGEECVSKHRKTVWILIQLQIFETFSMVPQLNLDAPSGILVNDTVSAQIDFPHCFQVSLF